ncbi:MAG: hypothetical protein AAB229_09575 [Candidatus Hydrogenedentota bacterium]
MKTIDYRFRLKSGEEKVFSVSLDEATLDFQSGRTGTPPAWTELSFCQCRNCPLDPAAHPHCPIALNLVDLIEFFKDSISHDEADVEVITTERSYHRKTTLQKGISALMGIFMVTSGCPVMNKLRPMVDSHLPFASAEETTFRLISMYLVAQYFRQKHGLSSDQSLSKLVVILDEIQKVDVDFCRRLKSIHIRDASLNALVILNTFGESAHFAILENDLERIEKIFLDHYGES